VSPIRRLSPTTAVLLGVAFVCLGSADARAECKCRSVGAVVALGECICVTRADGAQWACCDMVLNNTSWTFTEEGCPLAKIDPPGTATGRAFAAGVFAPKPQFASSLPRTPILRYQRSHAALPHAEAAD